jgi:hypothetical protein
MVTFEDHHTIVVIPLASVGLMSLSCKGKAGDRKAYLGAKALVFRDAMRPRAEALGYLEAKAPTKPSYGLTAFGYLEARLL